jgi:hypothetical protein
MKGVRVYPNEQGFLDGEAMRQPGAYGKPTFDFVKKFGLAGERMSRWDVCAPDGSGCILNPAIHKVTPHPDGSITVWPSIVTTTWHGWLELGVWRKV